MRHRVRKSRRCDVPVIKFRSSCDACTDAKVRCDKGHPHCGRCTRLGGKCGYSVSRRTRKPDIELAKALNTVTPLELPLGSSVDRHIRENSMEVAGPRLSADILHYGGGQDRFVDGILQTAAPATHEQACIRSPDASAPLALGLSQSPAMSRNQDVSAVTECDGAYAGGFNRESDIDQSVPHSFCVAPAMDLDFFSDLDFFALEPGQEMGIPTLKMGENSLSGGARAVDEGSQHTITSPQDEEHSCLRKTKRLQQSAIIMASKGEVSEEQRQIWGSTVPTTTADQALLMCSSTVKQLMEILRCRCESDAYLPFLLTVLISKVLATYTAIAKADDSTPFRFISAVRREEQAQETEKGEKSDTFAAVPLRLGAYEAEEDLEGLLRTQMVLYELSKMECVGQLFSERYCQTSEEDQRFAEDCIVYKALAEFIKNRYARTKALCELGNPLLTKKP